MAEIAHGRNVPFGFPTIDKFLNGITTSIKSIDLDAPSYQKANALFSKIRGNIDSVANFNGAKWGDFEIEAHQIIGRALDVLVPHWGSVVQKTAFKRAIEYGARQGVTVNIIRHQ
jgi:filamentous hemagglutinin